MQKVALQLFFEQNYILAFTTLTTFSELLKNITQAIQNMLEHSFCKKYST